MRLMEFLNPDIGTFFGLRFSRDTEERLEKWLADVGINAPERRERFHVTLAGSQESHMPGIKSDMTMDQPIEISPDLYSLDMYGDDKDILVLKFDDQRLQDRHHEIMSSCDSEWEYAYSPHFTMSVDPGEADLGSIALPDFPLFIAHEYSQPWEFNESILGSDRRRRIR